MAAGNEAILAGVAAVLQQASAALARLSASSPGGGGLNLSPATGSAGVESITGAVAALAQLASVVGGAGAGHAAPARPAGITITAPGSFSASAIGEEPALGSYEFCQQHGLETWVGDALELMLPSQRAAVINPEFNMARARNPNGIVMSRIKHAVPLDQRLGMWVEINGLSEGVVDRIRTLTPDQAELLLDSGFKIQKAENPSAVAMRRITDAIKQSRVAPEERAPWRSGGGGGGGGTFGGAVLRGRDDWAGSSRGGAADRSRTPAARSRWPPDGGGGGGRGAYGGGSLGGDGMPADIQQFMNENGLDWWCGEVLKRLSLFQRQQIIKDSSVASGVRNPSGVVMSRVKTVVDISELMSIFIDLNNVDLDVQEELLNLTPEQQSAVISPGIYLQNVRNPSTAVRSRINNVLNGREAVARNARR